MARGGHVGVFGKTFCGKSTVAMALSLSYWTKYRMRSIVFDITGASWGPHATVFNDEAKFLACLWASKNCAVFIDDATSTVARDPNKSSLFTQIRHNGHLTHVMGHDATNLLPIMRDQLGTVFVFRQSVRAAKYWADQFGGLRAKEMIQALTELPPYHYITLRGDQPPGAQDLKPKMLKI